MSLESLKNDDLQKGSSRKETLFFDYPLHAIWEKTKKLIHSDQWGQLAYEKVGNTCVVAGDPAGRTLKSKATAFENFRQWAHANKFNVCGYYFSEEFSRSVPMNRHKAGVSLLLDLKSWNLKGGASEEARRSLRKGCNQQLEFVEVLQESLSEWDLALMQFSRDWRKSKGLFQVRFLLTPLSRSLEFLSKGERLFVGHYRGELEAVVSVVSWAEGCWYVDQLMQHPKGGRFALDFLLVNIIQQLKREGAKTLSFGFCPGVIHQSNSAVERTLKAWGKIKLFYSPKGLYNFKKKYASQELDRYLLLDPEAFFPGQLWNMERATMVLGKNY